MIHPPKSFRLKEPKTPHELEIIHIEPRTQVESDRNLPIFLRLTPHIHRDSGETSAQASEARLLVSAQTTDETAPLGDERRLTPNKQTFASRYYGKVD